MSAVPVGVLTDAELAVLARPRTRVGPRPVMPQWARLAPGRREVAVREARAGLVARRLVDAAPGGRGVRPDLRAVLVLRESATAVVAVVRTTSTGGTDHSYAHVVADVALLEQVSADGTHRFALTTASALPEQVAAAVLHPGAVPAGASPPASATDWLRADVEVRDARRRWAAAWVSGPAGTFRVTRGEVPTDPDTVRQELAAALGRVVPGGVDEDG